MRFESGLQQAKGRIHQEPDPSHIPSRVSREFNPKNLWHTRYTILGISHLSSEDNGAGTTVCQSAETTQMLMEVVYKALFRPCKKIWFHQSNFDSAFPNVNIWLNCFRRALRLVQLNHCIIIMHWYVVKCATKSLVFISSDWLMNMSLQIFFQMK